MSRKTDLDRLDERLREAAWCHAEHHGRQGPSRTRSPSRDAASIVRAYARNGCVGRAAHRSNGGRTGCYPNLALSLVNTA